MEAVVRVLTVALVSALAAGCSVMFPSDFSTELREEGLQPGLTGLADAGPSLGTKLANQPLALVALDSTVVAVGQASAAAFSQGNLAPKTAKTFSTPFDESLYSELWLTPWNVAPDGNGGGTVWVLVNSLPARYWFTVGSGIANWNQAFTSNSHTESLGTHGGHDYTVLLNDGGHTAQFYRDSVAGALASFPSTADMFKVQTYDKGVFVVEDGGLGTPNGSGGYTVVVDDLPFSTWDTANAPVVRTYTAHLGPGLTDDSAYSVEGRVFRVYRAGGRTYLVAQFTWNSDKNQQLYSVEAFDDATGKRLYQRPPVKAPTWAASGGALYSLGPEGSLGGEFAVPLRKYVW